MRLSAINSVLRKIGLVLVIEFDGKVPTRLWIETYRSYKRRCKSEDYGDNMEKQTAVDLAKTFSARGDIQPAARICDGEDVGIAVQLDANISEVWQAGKVMVFWRDGDVTVLPESEFYVLNDDLY